MELILSCGVLTFLLLIASLVEFLLNPNGVIGDYHGDARDV